MGPNTAKRWTNNDIVLANGTRIIAVGTGQRVRGFIEGDTRPNLIIVDDYDFFSSGVKSAVDDFVKENNSSFELFVAPKYLGYFALIKRVKN